MVTIEMHAVDTDQPIEKTTAERARFKFEMGLFLVACGRTDEAAQLLGQGFDLINELIEAGH